MMVSLMNRRTEKSDCACKQLAYGGWTAVRASSLLKQHMGQGEREGSPVEASGHRTHSSPGWLANLSSSSKQPVCMHACRHNKVDS